MKKKILQLQGKQTLSFFIKQFVFGISSIFIFFNTLKADAYHSVQDKKNFTLENPIIHSKMTKDQFFNFVKKAHFSGISKVTLTPDAKYQTKSISTFNNYGTGDVFVLLSLNYNLNDSNITQADYNDLFETIKRFSWLKFRIIMNLVSTTANLEEALENKRPTIIIWTSHGNSISFYDNANNEVPHDIFKKTSPAVYQFHLTACHGRLALDNSYKPSIPKTLMSWAWSDFVYHPGSLAPHFSINNSDWNPFLNYPGPLVANDLICLENKNNKYVITRKSDGTVLVGEPSDSFENCVYKIVNSNEGFFCSSDKNKKWYSTSIIKNEITLGASLEKFDCIHHLASARNKLLCRTLTDGVHYIYADTNAVSEMKFDSITTCISEIRKLSPL